jgi:hypothetical protein
MRDHTIYTSDFRGQFRIKLVRLENKIIFHFI